MKIIRWLKAIMHRHHFVYFCRPSEDPQWKQFRYCPECALVEEFLYDSNGGSYISVDNNNKRFVWSWIASRYKVRLMEKNNFRSVEDEYAPCVDWYMACTKCKMRVGRQFLRMQTRPHDNDLP